MSEWPTEEAWREQLRASRNALRSLQANAHFIPPKVIEDARRRIERIRAGGRAEWQARDNPSRFP
ncbi:MAG TPA: hypothetical protein VI168_15570 [Croceibacterium sp.]